MALKLESVCTAIQVPVPGEGAVGLETGVRSSGEPGVGKGSIGGEAVLSEKAGLATIQTPFQRWVA